MDKKRLREKTWDDYGISRHRYKELEAFCLQYEEKRSKINYGITSGTNDGMPKGNYKGNQLESLAIRNTIYKKDCEMIEQAAVTASAELYPYIIKSVTNGLSYRFVEYDETMGKIPVGKTDFYAYRRLFYYFLDKIKNGDKIDLIP